MKVRRRTAAPVIFWVEERREKRKRRMERERERERGRRRATSCLVRLLARIPAGLARCPPYTCNW